MIFFSLLGGICNPYKQAVICLKTGCSQQKISDCYGCVSKIGLHFIITLLRLCFLVFNQFYCVPGIPDPYGGGKNTGSSSGGCLQFLAGEL